MRILWLGLLLVPLAAGSHFDSGDMEPGETWSFTFDDEFASGYTYHCHPHPWMTAMVHVNPDTDGEVTTVLVDIVEGASSDDWGYSVEHLTIEVGDTVTWTNAGTMVHTVTAMSHDGSGGNHDHGDHDHGDDPKDTPGLPLMAALSVLLGIALRRAKQL